MAKDDLKTWASLLSTALELPRPDRHAWTQQDLRDMWRHQLAAPLRFGLGHLSGEASHRLNEGGLDPMLSLGQLFACSEPSLQLLKLVRRFAKSCRGGSGSSLPSELVMLTYYTSIAVARLRLGARISSLGDEPLLRGLRWYGKQVWVDEATRGLLAAAKQHLSTGLD